MQQQRKQHTVTERYIQVEADSKTEQQRYISILRERERNICSERHKDTTREKDIDRQTHTHIERPQTVIQRQRHTQRWTNRGRQRQTETDRDRQRQAPTSRDEQRQTETDS